MQPLKSLIYIILRAFGFPRQDLEARWWHRMFKVLIPLITLYLFLVYNGWVKGAYKPYYVYSFENDFHSYSGQSKKWTDVQFTPDQIDTMVFMFRNSLPHRHDYVTNLEKSGKTYGQIGEQLKKEGQLHNVMVKDLQTDFAGPHERILWLFTLTLVTYLILTQMAYRGIAYILAGRAKTFTTSS